MKEKTEIGKRIKQIRLSLGDTTEAFGKRFDPPANRGLVSGWENGRYLPNPERLKQIADLGNITVDKLVRGYYENDKELFVEEFEVLLKKLTPVKLKNLLKIPGPEMDLLMNNKDVLFKMYSLMSASYLSFSSKDAEKVFEKAISITYPLLNKDLVSFVRQKVVDLFIDLTRLTDESFNLDPHSIYNLVRILNDTDNELAMLQGKKPNNNLLMLFERPTDINND